jgi:riboflavin kinase / FMN adenylyltransferase
MRIHRRFGPRPPSKGGVSVAIGNFDGVHLGHRTVLAAAGDAARRGGLAWGVVTFEPHPRELLSPAAAPLRITPFRRKAELLRGFGVEACFVLPFEPKLMQLSPERFVDEVLIGRMGVRAVAAGADFRFGHKRAGDMDLLARLGAERGLEVEPVPPFLVDGAVCSSSRIRELLQLGEIGAANRLLGAPFELEGMVRTGDRRGRGLGFPTANLLLANSRLLLPARGVYVVRAGLMRQGRLHWFDAVANLGVNPTFAGQELRLEVHLLDGDHELYGQRLKVAFVDRLRDEESFASADALIEQMHRDCAAARRIHATRTA